MDWSTTDEEDEVQHDARPDAARPRARCVRRPGPALAPPVAFDLPRLRPWSRPREALRLLVSGATARTCVPVALVVGTLLSLVNQGDVVAQGMAGATVGLKVLANYTIPFLTSSTGALLAVRERPVRRG